MANRFDPTKRYTYGEICKPALACFAEQEAIHILADMVEYYVKATDMDESEALQTAKTNIAYIAGHCTKEIEERVTRLFNTVHPYFANGTAAAVNALEAIQIGANIGEKMKEDIWNWPNQPIDQMFDFSKWIEK